MTSFTTNPFIYIFSAIAVGIGLLYIAFSVIDRMGLKVTGAMGTVTGKQYAEGGKSYYTTIVGGRSYVQSQETAESYVVSLNVDNEKTSGFVSKELFKTLNLNDRVHVKVRRTRITGRLEVVEITK